MKVFSRTILLCLLIPLVLTVFSCRKKMVCPAYTTAFILGDQEQLQFLSQFTEDSLPELKEELRSFMKKNEFGIVVDVKKKKKWKLLQFVPAEMIMPLVDSTLLDSTGQMFQPGYNRDMIVYNRKFGDLLVFEKPVKKDTSSSKQLIEEEEDEDADYLDPDDPDYDPWSDGGDSNW